MSPGVGSYSCDVLRYPYNASPLLLRMVAQGEFTSAIFLPIEIHFLAEDDASVEAVLFFEIDRFESFEGLPNGEDRPAVLETADGERRGEMLETEFPSFRRRLREIIPEANGAPFSMFRIGLVACDSLSPSRMVVLLPDDGQTISTGDFQKLGKTLVGFGSREDVAVGEVDGRLPSFGEEPFDRRRGTWSATCMEQNGSCHAAMVAHVDVHVKGPCAF